MKYQAILFDLDGTLLPMDEAVFVKRFFGLLVPYITPTGMSQKIVGDMLNNSLRYVICNDGRCTNEQAFIQYYDAFGEENGCEIKLSRFEEFYATVFDKEVRDSCGFDPQAKRVVEFIKSTNTPILLATNPFFPRVGTHARLRWAGLEPNDFTVITTYENSHYCKPNLMYYRELFERTGYDPARCLMVGNNVAEDMIAKQLGCDVYLILRNLINPDGEDITQYKHGDLCSLLAYLQTVK